MSVEEYLRATFSVADREYLDGQIVPRHFGELPHSETLHNLSAAFHPLRKKSLCAY